MSGDGRNGSPGARDGEREAARALEAFLARVYVDDGLRARVIADPRRTARDAGLSEPQCEQFAKLDVAGLVLAARSFAGKRRRAPRARHQRRWWVTLAAWARRVSGTGRRES
jgi:hypothetical protein